MKIHSIQTSAGAAVLADLSAGEITPVQCPEGWGLILWGRRERSLVVGFALHSKADWIADYSPNVKGAIVSWSAGEPIAGSVVEFDTAVVSAICPHCGSTKYTSQGANWLCKGCGRCWRKVGKRQNNKGIEGIA